ncbi:MAG: metallophosphoesterase [Propionibacteriaceae bacterium]|nr:metallophosphoesterase [Propionibacteriaceae bacterium]
MSKWFTVQPSRIALVGDVHGNWAAAKACLLWAGEQQADVVVFLGDFGFDFEPPYGKHQKSEFEACVNRWAGKLGIDVLYLNGNHDNWAWTDSERERQGIAAVEPLQMAEHVWNLGVGQRLPWGERGWLVVPGGVSIDRVWRQYSRQRIGFPIWWENEALTDAQIDDIVVANTDRPVDVVVAHDCPYLPGSWLSRHLSQNEPIRERSEISGIGQKELRDSDDHQLRLLRIFDSCLADDGLWAHGHYHINWRHEVQDSKRVIGLDCDGIVDQQGEGVQDMCLLVDAAGHEIDASKDST